MDQISSFITNYMPFLLNTDRYKVIEATETAVNGGDSVVVFASDGIQLRFITDRDQLFLDLRPPTSQNDKDWYSIDLVCRLLTGERLGTSILNPDYAEFVRTHLADIERKFAPAEWSQTEKDLKAVQRKRSKEMFG